MTPLAYYRNILPLETTQHKIAHAIASGSPYMATRLGSVEFDCLRHYVATKTRFWKLFPMGIQRQMENNAGFIRPSTKALSQFATLYLDELKKADLMGIWQKKEEPSFFQSFCPQSELTLLNSLSPFHPKLDTPWTTSLANKKVLIIHPFEDTIQAQYLHRSKLFGNPNILPEFTLITLKAVQSIAKSPTGFETWFDALAYMKDQVSQTTFDVAIIAAGAYGLPLAAHVKTIGKTAVHLGGTLQLLFGIKGRRWDTESAYIPTLYNDYWTRPSESERPSKFKQVESGTYW
jgi:hypothetical protein